MDFLKSWWRETLVALLIFSNIFVWISFYQKEATDTLRVYFLNIGQGDAIFIDSPQHNRILIDGGRNRRVLSELGRVLPFADKRIDVVLATHPDADHIGGLPEVVSRYKIGAFIESGVESETLLSAELSRRLDDENISRLLARRGMVINLGDGVKLQILFPLVGQDVSNWETNKASIVAKLVYGDKSFMLTGDSPINIENVLLNLDPVILDSDVLKAGHHGSRTSTSLTFAEAVSPEYTVISAGKDNSYGHPHREVLDILEKVGGQILSTIDKGTIKFEIKNQILKVK